MIVKKLEIVADTCSGIRIVYLVYFELEMSNKFLNKKYRGTINPYVMKSIIKL